MSDEASPMGSSLYAFEPDYSVAPGEILAEVLEEQRIRPNELATRLGVSGDEVDRLLTGTVPIDASSATDLERATGVSAGLWSGMESNYRAFGSDIESGGPPGQRRLGPLDEEGT